MTRAVKNQEDEAPMEVDVLYGPDDYYDDLEPGCECVALHERGFRGPCFFCQKQGTYRGRAPADRRAFPECRPPSRLSKRT